MEDRLLSPKMAYYREVYQHSPMWTGQAGGRLIIYAEQGIGDIIQMARYFASTNNYTILHAPKSVHGLLAPLVDEVLDKEESTLPLHDYHIPSLSLPFLIKEAKVPYLFAPKLDVGIKIGIAYEGNPGYDNNLLRSCPLRYFKSLNQKLLLLQDQLHLPELFCEEVDLHAWDKNDLVTTASLINSVDLVISVDTSILHLAGALGQKAIGIFGPNHFDTRWRINWYPSVKLMMGKWENIFESLRIHTSML